jgi:hypothetical protein
MINDVVAPRDPIYQSFPLADFPFFVHCTLGRKATDRRRHPHKPMATLCQAYRRRGYASSKAQKEQDENLPIQ